MVLSLLLIHVPVPARDSPPGPDKPRPASAPPPPPTMPAPSVRADPFQVSHKMQQLAWARSQDASQFVTTPGAKTPAMSLKGLVNETLALLEIAGAGVYMVREGDTISLNKTGENIVIKIEKIDLLSLNVKVGTLQELIIVR
jgi:4-hydroxyphenylpyruvate dioxygenase-like putative hemolysin